MFMDGWNNTLHVNSSAENELPKRLIIWLRLGKEMEAEVTFNKFSK